MSRRRRVSVVKRRRSHRSAGVIRNQTAGEHGRIGTAALDGTAIGEEAEVEQVTGRSIALEIRELHQAMERFSLEQGMLLHLEVLDDVGTITQVEVRRRRRPKLSRMVAQRIDKPLKLRIIVLLLKRRELRVHLT